MTVTLKKNDPSNAKKRSSKSQDNSLENRLDRLNIQKKQGNGMFKPIKINSDVNWVFDAFQNPKKQQDTTVAKIDDVLVAAIANLIAVICWADNDYDYSEKDAVIKIAKALKIDKATLYFAVDKAIKKICSFDEKQIGNFVEESAKTVPQDKAKLVFAIVLECAHADDIIDSTEENNLQEIGIALGLPAAEVTYLIFDMFVHNNVSYSESSINKI